jgi:hypothetical protein
VGLQRREVKGKEVFGEKDEKLSLKGDNSFRNLENWWSLPGAAREFGDCTNAKPGFCTGWAPASRNWDETIQWMIHRSKGKALLSLIIKTLMH